MQDNYYLLAKDVLGLRTNLSSFKFSYGIYPPYSTQDEYENCEVKLELHIGNIAGTIKNRNRSINGKYHYFSGISENDSLLYQRAFLFNSKLNLLAEGLLTDTPKITANSTYYKYIQHRFMNLHSVGYILTDIASLLLLRHGYAPLHCSAFRYNNSTVVIFAPPNTGKTLSAMTACMEFGAEYIAEDLAITDGESIYSVPWTSTFRYYDKIEQGRGARIFNKAKSYMPLLELFELTKPQPITQYVQSDKLVDKANVTHVIILERGEKNIKDCSESEMFRKISNLNRYEFNYYKSPLITAYDFFNPNLKVREMLSVEDNILKKLVANAFSRTIITSEDASEYTGLILDNLS